jgi:hypothetical protein
MMQNIETLNLERLHHLEKLVDSMLKELDLMPNKIVYKNPSTQETFLQLVDTQNYRYLLSSYEQTFLLDI